MLETSLTLQDGSGAFRLWRAPAADAPGLRIIDVDYREPRPGGPATAGPLLSLTIEPEPCLRRAALDEIFPDLRLSSVANHDVPSARAYWSMRRGDAKVSFGFAMREPACLRGISIDVERP